MRVKTLFICLLAPHPARPHPREPRIRPKTSLGRSDETLCEETFVIKRLSPLFVGEERVFL